MRRSTRNIARDGDDLALVALSRANSASTPVAPGGRIVFTATDVYINALTGNDSNNGLTPSTAWKTHEALRAAIGVFGLIAPGGVGGGERWFSVHYEGAVPTDLQNLQCTLDANACIRFMGVDCVTTLHTGTISAVVPFTNTATRASITDTAVTDWTPYIGKRIRWTSGAAVGAIAWIMKDLGGGAAGLSYPGILFDVVETGISFPQATPPSTGTYVIEDLPACYLGNFSVQATPNGNQIEPFVNWIDLHMASTSFDGAYPQPQGSDATDFVLQGCLCDWQDPNDIDLLMCCCCFPRGQLPTAGAFVDYINCAHFMYFGYLDASFGLVQDCVAQGCGLVVLQGSFAEINNLAVYDAVGGSYPNTYGDAITCVKPSTPPGTVVNWGQGFLCGTGNAGVGWRVCDGTTNMTYYQIPQITGTLGDFALGLVTTASSYSDSTGTYSTGASIACTWANMAVPVTSGGFAEGVGSQWAGAHRPARNCHMLLANP